MFRRRRTATFLSGSKKKKLIRCQNPKEQTEYRPFSKAERNACRQEDVDPAQKNFYAERQPFRVPGFGVKQRRRKRKRGAAAKTWVSAKTLLWTNFLMKLTSLPCIGKKSNLAQF